jgi:CheY-like chemotaxis protein
MSTALTIMVVDDDPDAQFFVERSLGRALGRCKVITFPTAAAALAELKRGTAVDAIVTDHQLREATGCEFIGEVREAGHTCPVVMVTCSSDPEVARKAYAAGATRVFEAGGDDFAEFLKSILPRPKASTS